MYTTYKIDLQQLEKNYLEFADWGKVYFPVKTNHNPHILKKLKQLGSGFECDCIDHIKKIYSKRNAGEIIFSNVAKSEEDIKWAIKHKLTFYTVDDSVTLAKIINLAKQHKFKQLKINVRINVYDIFKKEFTANGTPDSRLGASVETVKDLLTILNADKEVGEIKIKKGISFYVQAEVHNKENMLEVVTEYLAKNFGNQFKLDWINIGGGSSIERLNKSKEKMYQNLEKLGVNTIILEPGRFMVDQVEDMYVPVRRIIETNLNGGETVASLSVGIYHGLLDYKLHKRNFNYNILTDNGLLKLESYTIGNKLVLRGPTADSSDVLGEFNMPNCEINNNSVFVIKNVGAYVEVLHSNFSGKVPLKFKIIK